MVEKKERKKRDTSKKREEILAAAVKLFSEQGYDGTSMDKIADQAGVSKITIYKHFEKKENLFLEIVSDFLKESGKRKPIGYDQKRAISEQLRDFIDAELYWIMDSEERGKSRVLASVYLFRIDFVLKTMKAHPFHVDFINWLNDAKEDGKITFEKPEMAAQIFYGMIEGCITWNALLTDGSSLQSAQEQINEIILTFLKAYGTKEISREEVLIK